MIILIMNLTLSSILPPQIIGSSGPHEALSTSTYKNKYFLFIPHIHVLVHCTLNTRRSVNTVQTRMYCTILLFIIILQVISIKVIFNSRSRTQLDAAARCRTQPHRSLTQPHRSRTAVAASYILRRVNGTLTLCETRSMYGVFFYVTILIKNYES